MIFGAKIRFDDNESYNHKQPKVSQNEFFNHRRDYDQNRIFAPNIMRYN